MLGLSFFALPACRESGDLALLEVHALEIDEDAALLYVLGNGFVSEAQCTIVLEGTEYPHGQLSRALTLGAPCRVLTDGRAVVELSHPALAARTRSWFEGKLTLRLSARDRARTVSGSTEAVRLRLGAHGTERAVDEALRHAQSARRFQRSVGIRSVEASARGLLVGAVDEAGSFVRAGGKEGDVVRRIEGAPVEDAADLIAPATLGHARFELVRRGQGTLSISVPLGGHDQLEPTLWGLTFALALLFGALLPSSPRRLELPRREGPLAFAACATLVFLSSLLMDELDAGLLWVMALLVHTALTIGRRRASSLVLAHAATDGAVATLSIAALALSVGTLRAPLLASEAELVPRTVALGSPAGLLALLGVWMALRPTREHGRLSSTPLLRAAAAWLCAALGLGAGVLPDLSERAHGPSPWLGWLLFTLEAALLYYAFAQASALQRNGRRALPVVLALASIALTWLAPHLERWMPAPELVLALGVGLCVGHLGRALWARHVAPPVPVRDPALTPFL